MKAIVLILLCLLALNFSGFSTEEKPTLDKSQIPRLKWVGKTKPGSFSEYLLTQKLYPKRIDFKAHFRPKRGIKARVGTSSAESSKILLVVNASIMSAMTPYIETYAKILSNNGYTAKLYTYSSGSAASLKEMLINEKENLTGAVFIGHIPSAWYEIEDDYYEYGYAEFPCDLYYMDLDGQWNDQDNNGKFDSHENGNGSVAPEIFIGRIDSGPMGDDENYSQLKAYFVKLFRFWNGEIPLIEYGLTYTEDDWSEISYFNTALSPLYGGEYDIVKAPSTNKSDYQARIQNPSYEFIQLSCHSSTTYHAFTRGGSMSNSEVKNAVPQALAYNLFCCSSLRYTDTQYLGGAYLFNESHKALAVIGSAKTGSMLDFDYFYKPLGNNSSFGDAFKQWFADIAPYGFWDICWHYGMTISGDPMIRLKSIPVRSLSPINLSAQVKSNRSLLIDERIIELSWEQHTELINGAVSKYRLYLVSKNSKSLISELGGNTKTYLYRNADKTKNYSFALCGVDSAGDESVPAFILVKK